MSPRHLTKRPCALCETPVTASQSMAYEELNPLLQGFLKAHHATVAQDGAVLCHSCLNQARADLVLEQLEKERGSLTVLESQMARSVASHLAIAESAEATFIEDVSFADRASDRLSEWMGSWPAVLGILGLFVFWVLMNLGYLFVKPFDPFPFILLNLFFSLIASIQAPIILMSQNRMEDRDRQRSQYDLRTNIKAELEIAALHAKVDHLLAEQWDRMVEIQLVQLDILRDLGQRFEPTPKPSNPPEATGA